MAVGGDGAGLLAAAAGEKWLQAGETVQYWSTSKGKWVAAVVKAVDSKGSVQISVKPKAWLSLQEQASKVRVGPSAKVAPSELAAGPPQRLNANLPQGGSNGISRSFREAGNGQANSSSSGGRNSVLSGKTKAADGTEASAGAGQSRALYSMFSGWDARRQNEGSGASGVSSGAEASPPQALEPAAGTATTRQQQKRSGADQVDVPANAAGQMPALKVFKDHTKEIKQYALALLQQPQRSVRKKVPSLLWRVFYRVIRDLSSQLKQLKDPRSAPKANGSASGGVAAGGKEDVKKVESDLTAALSEAEGCLQMVCSAMYRRIRAAELTATSGDASAAAASSARLHARLQAAGQLSTMLADVERYRANAGIGNTQEALNRAERLYYAALGACPELGQAFNQRGLLAAQRGDRLKAVRCGFHSLLCSFPFPNSKENLLVWLSQVATQGTGKATKCSARAPLCELQRRLLQLAGNSAMALSEGAQLGELVARAQDGLKEAVTAVQTEQSASASLGAPSKELDWLLEVLMITVCSAIYHVCGPPVPGTPTPGSPSTAPRAKVLSDSSPGFWAWDWLVRLGLCLADEVEAQGRDTEQEPLETPLLAPLALLSLLSALRLPDLWRAAAAAPLRDALRGLANMGAWGLDDAMLLQLSLPEDTVTTGLLRLPIVTETPADGTEVLVFSNSSARPAPVPEEDEELSDEEVVYCAPVMKTASPQKEAPVEALELPGPQFTVTGSVSRPAPAPQHLQSAVRRARLRFCLGAGLGKGGSAVPPLPGGAQDREVQQLDEEVASAERCDSKWVEADSAALGARDDLVREDVSADPYDFNWHEADTSAYGMRDDLVREDDDDDYMDFYADQGETLEELGEEPDLWDTPDGPADPNDYGDWPTGIMPEAWAQPELTGGLPQDDAILVVGPASMTLPPHGLAPMSGPPEDDAILAIGPPSMNVPRASSPPVSLPPDVASMAAAAAANAAAAAIAAWTPPPGLGGPQDFGGFQREAARCAAALASDAVMGTRTPAASAGSVPNASAERPLHSPPPGLAEAAQPPWGEVGGCGAPWSLGGFGQASNGRPPPSMAFGGYDTYSPPLVDLGFLDEDPVVDGPVSRNSEQQAPPGRGGRRDLPPPPSDAPPMPPPPGLGHPQVQT
eukprot:TRINITY_DN9375_c0_g2_i1.p1 TRINITY_DN9375_c0_g2~~TRINITY_DN9375_c0_g2_i1.p1  ORF type:complete len:1181 (+),score=280.13 TRINITY_DN9375_c0_g2_i1:119-3544(+)